MSPKTPSIEELDEIIRTMETMVGLYPHVIRMLPHLKELRPALLQNQGGNESQQRQPSYVQLAIAVLAEIGHPTPITVLLERIRERRNDPTITRGSVETSLLRHLNSKGDKAEVVKPSPGTYALREHMHVAA